jgi:hypothetical protein
VTHDADLPLADAWRQVCHERARTATHDRPALEQLERCEARGGLDLDPQPAAARGVEAVALERRARARAHALEQRKEHASEIVPRRRRWVVSPALDDQQRRPLRQEQRRQDGLHHETRAPCGCDREAILAGSHSTRAELELGRAELRLARVGASDVPRGANGRQVLAQQARLRPAGADLLDPERRAGDQRQRERAAQDLPAAFPL